MSPKFNAQDNVSFLLDCIHACNVKASILNSIHEKLLNRKQCDFKLIGERLGIQPVTVRKRYQRLKNSVESINMESPEEDSHQLEIERLIHQKETREPKKRRHSADEIRDPLQNKTAKRSRLSNSGEPLERDESDHLEHRSTSREVRICTRGKLVDYSHNFEDSSDSKRVDSDYELSICYCIDGESTDCQQLLKDETAGLKIKAFASTMCCADVTNEFNNPNDLRQSTLPGFTKVKRGHFLDQDSVKTDQHVRNRRCKDNGADKDIDDKTCKDKDSNNRNWQSDSLQPKVTNDGVTQSNGSNKYMDDHGTVDRLRIQSLAEDDQVRHDFPKLTPEKRGGLARKFIRHTPQSLTEPTQGMDVYTDQIEHRPSTQSHTAFSHTFVTSSNYSTSRVAEESYDSEAIPDHSPGDAELDRASGFFQRLSNFWRR